MVEDGTYIDEDDYTGDEGVNEIQRGQESQSKKVRFVDLVNVRPIPAMGKGRREVALGEECQHWER